MINLMHLNALYICFSLSGAESILRHPHSTRAERRGTKGTLEARSREVIQQHSVLLICESMPLNELLKSGSYKKAFTLVTQL